MHPVAAAYSQPLLLLLLSEVGSSEAVHQLGIILS